LPQEVEISGAGPSGLAAAITLAKAGWRVRLYERNQDVGWRFQGDFQGLENWTEQHDVLEEFRTLGIAPTFEYRPFRRAVLFDPDHRECRCRSDRPLFYLVRRGREAGTLDSALKAQALDAGVDIRFGTAARHLPQGGIIAEGPRAADAIAVGYLFDTDHADGAWGIVSEDMAPKGYAYLLVWQGRGTLATCMFRDFHREKEYLKRSVEFFRSTVGVDMNNARPFGGAGNFALPRTATRDRLLLIGEAAGFQDMLWGFGMRYAILSGHLAARAWIEGNPSLYDALWRQRFGGLLRSGFVNRMFYNRLGNWGYRRMVAQIGRRADAGLWLNSYYRPRPWKTVLSALTRRWMRLRGPQDPGREGCDCTWCRCQHECSPLI